MTDHLEALSDFTTEYRERVDTALEHWLPGDHIQPHHLHEAMRYSVISGGKRVRPVLVYATGRALGADAACMDGAACAVELIHAYSLVHDDLPSMDDDDLRRGRATCHRAFGEATALLVGDALQSLAFYILAHDPNMRCSGEQRLAMVETLALASGSRGMAGGQAIDLAAVGSSMDLTELEFMHIHKTGALIRASVKMGALASPDCDEDTLARLDHYAKCIGLAFQIRDDILDVESDSETLGKQAGADIARNKPTYPSIVGLVKAKQMVEDLHRDALESVAGLDERADPLRWLADYIVQRDH